MSLDRPADAPQAPGSARRIAVIGGGISGLAAAWFLRQDGPEDLRVTVLEASRRRVNSTSASAACQASRMAP